MDLTIKITVVKNYLEKIWKRWLDTKEQTGPKILKCDLKVLFTSFKGAINDVLPVFFSEVRNANGDPYPPKRLIYFLHVMQMIVKDCGLEYNLLTDQAFKRTRNCVDLVVRDLTACGHQPDTKSPEVVSPEMEAELYSKGILGDTDPYILLETVYFILGKHFPLRSRSEHRELTFGADSQIELRGIAPNESFHYVNKRFKNHWESKRKGVVYSTGRQNCPVRLIKLYISKVPPGAQSFYCRPSPKFQTGLWYTRTAVGKNTLSGFMSKIAKRAGWDTKKKWTGHSLRTTATNSLSRNNNDKKMKKISDNKKTTSLVSLLNSVKNCTPNSDVLEGGVAPVSSSKVEDDERNSEKNIVGTGSGDEKVMIASGL